MVLVVTDPVRGAGPTHPLRGRAMTVSKFLCELGRLQGVSYLITGFGVSIKNKIARNSSKIKVCNQVWSFLSIFFFFTRATSSGDEFRRVSSIPDAHPPCTYAIRTPGAWS